jgi:hypothetical protein
VAGDVDEPQETSRWHQSGRDLEIQRQEGWKGETESTRWRNTYMSLPAFDDDRTEMRRRATHRSRRRREGEEAARHRGGAAEEDKDEGARGCGGRGGTNG